MNPRCLNPPFDRKRVWRKPGFGSPAQPSRRPRQADLIREALTHDPHVVLVESVKAVDPALLQAIEDAQSRGVTVVVVGRMPAGENSAESTAGRQDSDAKSAGPRRVAPRRSSS